MSNLRAMRWWDIEPVMAIEREAFANTAWTTEMFWSELSGVPESRNYLVVEGRGEVAGYAGVMAWGAEADVQTIAVASAYRRLGLASVLLDGLEDDAARRGCNRILLEVSATNHPARALYERHGYTQVSKRPDYYGRGLDALVLQKRLDPSTEPL